MTSERAGLSALVAMGGALACARATSPHHASSHEEPRVEAVSSVPIQVEPAPSPTLELMKPLRRVESRGDCAPRYSNGELGACVNGQPCRGFAAENAAGQLVCTCYGEPGCSEGQRCDEKKLVCVPEATAPFMRQP